MKQILILLVIVSVFGSCTNTTKKTEASDDTSNAKAIDSLQSELDIQKTFPDFVQMTKLPDSINLDIEKVFYGDFNGDGKQDLAAPILNPKTRFYGVIIIHDDPDHTYTVIKVGSKIEGLTNRKWIDQYDIIPKGQYIAPTLVDKNTGDIIGPNRKKVFKLLGDAISMKVKESYGGGIIFWNGKSYDWYHIE